MTTTSSGLPTGVWLIAGTPAQAPYPCRCDQSGCRPRYCPCAGRTDTDGLPHRCCARRAEETRQRHGHDTQEET